MSDHDRGAYAPHSDAPLTFETFDTRGRAGRRPFPMALIGSGVVLLLLVTALVMFYRSGAKGAEAMPRPVGGGIAAIKTAPTGEQPVDPTAGLEVYSPQNVPANTTAASAPAPQFTAPPEQPMTRPAPPPPVAAKAPAPRPVVQTETAAAASATPAHADAAPTPGKVAGATSPVVAETTSETPPSIAHAAKPAPPSKATPATTKATATSKSQTAASEQDEDVAAVGATTPSLAAGTITTALKPTSSKAAPAKASATASTKVAAATPKVVVAKKVAAAPIEADDTAEPVALPKGSLPAAKPATAPASASKGSFVVQVGAFPSAADADKGFSTASAKAGGAMSGKSKHVETVQKNGRTLYRSTVKGFATRDAAAAFCVALRAKGGQCIVRGGAGA